jgi:hypothetical protein
MAKEVFGDKADAHATEEIFYWLERCNDEKQLAKDLLRVHEHAKRIYETETPSPEQTLGIFDMIYGEEDEN